LKQDQLDAKIKKYNEKLKKVRDHANDLATCIQNLQKLALEPQYKRNDDGTLKKDKVESWKYPNHEYSRKPMTDEEHTKCVNDCCKDADSIKFN